LAGCASTGLFSTAISGNSNQREIVCLSRTKRAACLVGFEDDGLPLGTKPS
jgi:hypothetical protein